MNIFTFRKRACRMGAEYSKRHPKWGPYTVVVVHYLDGKLPGTEEVGKAAFGSQAKLIRGAQAIYWGRVSDLVQQGMDLTRARNQAMAEQTKGVLAAGF